MADNNRRTSSRSSKRKSTAIINDEDSKKKVRPCDKTGCPDDEPTCCLQISHGCAKSGFTSRWYHMSLGEHFCNNCFDHIYRHQREGYEHFAEWINDWTNVARVTKPTIKRYVANELLPYWVKCNIAKCGKWRLVRKQDSLDFLFIQKFDCSMASQSNSCDFPEDKAASLAFDPYFMDQLTESPLLKNSPAAPYLKRFLSEDIGLCPLNSNVSPIEQRDNMELFLIDQNGEASIWPPAFTVNEDEMQLIKNTLIGRATYLGIRNLIVVVWNLCPKIWLDTNKLSPYIVCRGLVRIHLLSLVDFILKMLTKKSVINYGIIQNPSLVKLKTSDPGVLIIGAGISGLAAAKQLQNFGIKVTVFESNSEIGGRLKNNDLLSSGYFVKGIINNPLLILAFQGNMKYQTIEGESIIFDSKGKPVPFEKEKNMQYKLRGLAQGALDTAMNTGKDSSWYDEIVTNYKKMPMTNNESSYQLLYHLLDHFQIELGADLKNLSILNWEGTNSVKGSNAVFPDGIIKLLQHLAENIEISFKNEVKKIDFSKEIIKVITSIGEYFFSKVLVTVPVPILRNKRIDFIPALPEFKQKAFQSLGDYYCAELIMEFPKKFWDNSTKKPLREFSIISKETKIQLFLDVTLSKKNSPPTLVGFLTGEALSVFENKTDKDVVENSVKLLRIAFGKKVPFPSKWYLLDAKKTEYNSYGSYLKVGCEKTAFDDMAKAVENKIFFAGEGTFRNIPGSLTGSFLSGLREASKIAEHSDL